ncbi:MAG: hypothetical protein ACHQ7N_21640, partial [Candidatus Methylomirabilales bacterium]
MDSLGEGTNTRRSREQWSGREVSVVLDEPLVRWDWVLSHTDEIWQRLLEHVMLTAVAGAAGRRAPPAGPRPPRDPPRAGARRRGDGEG